VCWEGSRRRPPVRSASFEIRRVPAQILGLCDFCHVRRWYNHPLDSGEAMAERDMTAREDRFLGLCLVALMIIIAFLFILTTS
jgi:hypothetical protein